ncbi:hypothetical protein CRG98_026955 [Punica granatum]|nr:hypothetical protein CRG98_026955 [Punica granatum]
MEKKVGSSTGKSDKEEASTSNTKEVSSKEYSLGRQRMLSTMAIHVVTDLVLLIEVLIHSGRHVPDLTIDREDLLMRSTNMRDRINEIKDCFDTLREINEILEVLDCMKVSYVYYWEERLRPYTSMWAEYFRRSARLTNSTQGLKFVLTDLVLHPNRSWLDELLGTSMSR